MTLSNLTSSKSTLDSRESTLDSRESTLDSRESTLDSRESTLDSRESTLDSRELNCSLFVSSMLVNVSLISCTLSSMLSTLLFNSPNSCQIALILSFCDEKVRLPPLARSLIVCSRLLCCCCSLFNSTRQQLIKRAQSLSSSLFGSVMLL
jgi:hypothetical protein